MDFGLRFAVIVLKLSLSQVEALAPVQNTRLYQIAVMKRGGLAINVADLGAPAVVLSLIDPHDDCFLTV
jgi:hypothetical protein